MLLKSKIVQLFLIFNSFQTRVHGEAVSSVGNGGDIIYCSPNEPVEFPSGYYALDYVTSFNYTNNNSDIVNLAWPESSQRIIKLLKIKAPHLGYSLETFVNDFLNESDVAKEHVWRARRFGLVTLKNEALLEEFPKNCINLDTSGKVQLNTAIIREQRNNKVLFSFDPRYVSQNRLLNDINFSYLLIHEWLWNFCTNARVVRDINNILHSNKLELLSEKDLQLTLEQFGLMQNGEIWTSARSMDFYINENGAVQIHGNLSPFLNFRLNPQRPQNKKLKIYNSTPYNINIIYNNYKSFVTISPYGDSITFLDVLGEWAFKATVTDPASQQTITELNFKALMLYNASNVL